LGDVKKPVRDAFNGMKPGLKGRMRRSRFVLVAFLSLAIAVWASTVTIAKPDLLIAGSSGQSASHTLTHKRPSPPRCPGWAVTRTTPGQADGGSMVLGMHRILPNVGEAPSGVARGFAFSAVSTGDISAVHVYVDARNRAHKLMVAVYSNSGCRPGSRLTRGSLAVPVRAARRHPPAARGAGAWRVVNVRSTHLVSGRTYWLVVLGSGGMLRFRDQRARRCTSPASANRHLKAFPKSWKSGATSRACGVSAYVAARFASTLGTSPGGGGGSGPPGVGGSPGGSAPPAASPYANLWVSTQGGSCTRQATPGLEIPSQDCGSLSAAYQAAACGDVVNIVAGAYTAQQNLLDKPALDGCANPVIFEAAAGLFPSQVVFGDPHASNNSIDAYDLCCGNHPGASNWLLQNVTVLDDIYLSANNVTINNVDGPAIYIGGATNVTVENSNLGPCYNLISLSSGTNNNGSPAPSHSPNPSVRCNSNIKIAGGTNITFRNNVIHDFLDDDSNGAYDHFECMFIAEVSNMTIDGNKFYDCQIYSIFLQDFAGPINGVTIQNNWFWANQGGMGGCTSDVTGCPAENAGGSNEDAVTFGASDTGISNVLIRYNSFDPCCGVAQEGSRLGSGVRLVGNILGPAAGTCISGASYAYNLFQAGGDGGPCGTGDATTSTNPFVSTGKSGTVADDLHLRCGTSAQNFVTPNTSDYQLGYDIDGNARNSGGPRDAGASAEASCGT